MGFCSCTIKLILIIFNLICAIAGLAILAIGVISNNNGGNFKSLLSGQVTTSAIFLMVLGSVIFLIAFFGCCGALREDACMIQTYGVILLTIIIVEIALGVAAFLLKPKIDSDLQHSFFDFFSQYSKNHKAIDDIQTSLQCCGYDGPTFWNNLSPPQNIPNSCCKSQNNCDVFNSYQDGCFHASRHYIGKILNVIGGVAIGIAVIELAGVICAFYIGHTIRRAELKGYV